MGKIYKKNGAVTEGRKSVVDTFFTHAYHTVAEAKRITFLIHIVLLLLKYEHAKL